MGVIMVYKPTYNWGCPSCIPFPRLQNGSPDHVFSVGWCQSYLVGYIHTL